MYKAAPFLWSGFCLLCIRLERKVLFWKAGYIEMHLYFEKIFN